MSMKYVALLRGINVGGNKKVPMADLKQLFKKLGHEQVVTILNTGNVVFESSTKSISKLTGDIEAAIEKKFGFPVPVQIKKHADVVKLVKHDPFAKIPDSKTIKRYATFLAKAKKVTHAKNLPFSMADAGGAVVLTVVDLDDSGTLPMMNYLDTTYGKDVTTRNWNTVEKIANCKI